MKDLAVLFICVLLAAVMPAQAEQGDAPVTQLQPAEVSIDPIQDGRRLIRLPSVEFTLQLTPACAPERAFQSLSISIADTRRTFGAADFSANEFIETRMRVPGRQIGPLAVDDFCVASAEYPTATLTVGDAFTASVSVRCGNEALQSVAYDTLALDVLLVCNVPDDAGQSDAAASTAPDEEDQESSSSFRF